MKTNDNKGKKLIKNTLILTIGKISTQIITFFLLPVYTYYLSTTEYGIVDLMATLVSFLLPIVTLQIEQGIFRFLIDYRNNIEEKKILISTTFFSLIMQCILLVLIFICFNYFISNEYKWFLLTNVLGCIFSTTFLQIARGLGDNTKYTIGSVLISLTTITLNILFIVILKMGAIGMLLGTLSGYIVGVIYIFLSEKIYNYIHIKKFSKNKLKELLAYSFPLVPTMISWWIVNVSDRLLITYFLGAAMNGIYSVANKFSTILTTIYGIFNLTWTESASININSEDTSDFFNLVFDKVIRLVGALCIGIIAFMPCFFNILVDTKFYASFYQIPILIIACFFCNLSSFEGGIYIAKKKSKEVAKSTIAASMINIIVNLSLINYIGLYAASLSSLIAYLIIFIYRFIDLKKYVKLKIDFKLFLMITFLFFMSILSYYLGNIYIYIIIAIISTIFCIILNLNTLIEIFSIIIKKINH